MPLSFTDIRSDVNAQFVSPCSILCDWQQVGTGTGYFNTADTVDTNGFITNPNLAADGGQLIAARAGLRRDNRMGTLLAFRMRYQGSIATVIIPQGKVFGRKGPAGAWQIMKNRLGDTRVALSVDVSDLHIGSDFYTTPDPDMHYFDTQGCDEFVVAVEMAVGSGSTITSSWLQVKFV